MHASLKVNGGDIRVEKLLAGTRVAGNAAGPVSAHVALKGQGKSIADLAGGASGTASLSMSNGVVSKLADAILELDLGKALRAMVSGNQSIPVNRIDIAFDFDKGIGHARNIFIDTERTRMVGTGRIDLRKEQLVLELDPIPKKPGLFALNKLIQVNGALRKPKIVITDKEESKPRTSSTTTGPMEKHVR